MKNNALAILLLCSFVMARAQNGKYISLNNARFSTGDNPDWKNKDFADQTWRDVKVGEVWQSQGFPDYHGFAWYRIHVKIPAALKSNSVWKDSIRIFLAHVNDVDETYFNGTLIGKTGGFPNDKGGYISKWPAVRNYCIASSNPLIKWDGENVIAVKVYDGGGSGGIFMGSPFIDMLEKFDGIEFSVSAIQFLAGQKAKRTLTLFNRFNTVISGDLRYRVVDEMYGKTISRQVIRIKVNPFESKKFILFLPHREGIKVYYDFKELSSGKAKSFTEVAPYLLTPAELLNPILNGPLVIGVHPGSPIIYKIAASGQKPMIYAVDNIPAGLSFDAKTGILTGIIDIAGNYKLILRVKNNIGSDKKELTIKIGAKLALTPPMGWNSWNCWGLNVTEEKVKSSAKAMVQSGLADYGWNYVNVDDGWQAAERSPSGKLFPNSKFADMKELGNVLHAAGLKFGIYSSPGAKTCGGFLGSLGHEKVDADTYTAWGVDYLKYDLCSYSDNTAGDTTLFAQQKPYKVMGDALKLQHRDIVYSICQYGIRDVWKWGKAMDGNLWRTTEDITDTWASLRDIGFSQADRSAYASPGGWNDPDMLIVGQVGWGENLHPSNLTPYEQYAHISLWSMLSAPMLIGCDMSKLDAFTLNLLKNREVIALDQDTLGKQAIRTVNTGGIQVWEKKLSDGGLAIGVFNLNDKYCRYNLRLTRKKNAVNIIRDVWIQKDIKKNVGSISLQVAPHGVKLLKITGS
ncbi:putative Ig domain-containing protein [Mucilaginibacter gracilis]|uniref:Alpha-galactosidase n=1 Tax=Mucilaginibacter gracilis TaxID=423350 RepID=A0A495IVI2_9SPHI|nr:putative Ig domain-containing protein [Mucilaginibacter gracilis]RKR80483.1 putative Ig domain-containing protein [Mucilaginibacter gracilis]